MTMPDERARALRWAGELLREMLNDQAVPEGFRKQIPYVLRHYPSADEITRQARLQDSLAQANQAVSAWLGPVGHEG